MQAQERMLRKANNNYEKFAYMKAADMYLKIIEKGDENVEVYQKLGDCYYFNSDLKNASKWYKEMVNTKVEVRPEYFFRYAQTLKHEGDYKEANRIMRALESEGEGDSRVSRLIANPDYLDDIAQQSGRFDIASIEENSVYTDFAPSFYNDQLVYASARKDRAFMDKKNKWTQQPYLDLYTKTEEGSETIQFSKKVSTRLHESTSTFTKDGSTMYFTRNNLINQKFGTDDLEVNRLKIFKATLNNNGKWTNIEELPFNNDYYSVAHPALSPDETKLYFASDMPGGYGLSDLYVVDILEDGSFGEPKNLGVNVNTEGRDTFPFMSQEEKLYFSSDGHLGLGGLDIFVKKLNEIKVYNVGEPINSIADDVTFIIDEEGKGYFASNRPGGKGDDDIYSFVETTPIVEKCDGMIRGLVKDQETNELLSNVKIKVLNENEEVIYTIYSDFEGKFIIENISCNRKNYELAFSTDGYKSKNTIAQLDKDNPDFYEEIQIEQLPKQVEIGADLAETLKLEPIYFNTNRYFIRKDAAAELDKVVTFLQDNPLVSIEIGSHTDSTAGDWYNLWLSNKRASATVDYIVKTGIKKSRVSGKGYGETKLKNECSNGVPCSKENHQLNRRSEFIVLNN